MDCGNESTSTLAAVAIEDGWWRDTAFSDRLYECPYADSCEGGECTEGHEGVTCRVCSDGYFLDSIANKCKRCKGGFSLDPTTWTPLFAALVAALAALVAWALAKGCAVKLEYKPGSLVMTITKDDHHQPQTTSLEWGGA